MTRLTAEQVRQFWERGYVIARQVFTSDDVQRFRAMAERLKARTQGTPEYGVSPRTGLEYVVGDPLGKPEFAPADYIILDERFISTVKSLLGERIVYFGDCSMQRGEGTRGWHKDNVDRANPDGPDWGPGRYDVIRCGIYLQDHRRHSGGVKVKARSHLKTYRRLQDGTWGGRIHAGMGRTVIADSEPGDVVIWTLRTSHSGNVVRLKGLPGLPVHPLLERFVPRALRVPEQAQRISVFCAFGAPGTHVDRYIDFIGGRTDMKSHFQYSGYGDDVRALAARRGVEIVPPTPDYGTRAAGHAVTTAAVQPVA